ncbi:hypothetical protein ACYOEI_20415 [Singulisphaera rosea]
MGHAKSLRFTLLHAMIFVVAVAVGLAIPRSLGNFVTVRRDVTVSFQERVGVTSNVGVNISDFMNRETAGWFRPPIKGWIIYWSRQITFWPGPCLAALSLATFGLGLRQDRRFARRPGMAMGLGVVIAIMVAAVRLPHLLIAGPSLSNLRVKEWWLEFWFTLPGMAGFAVAVSWATLVFGGRWRVGRGWLNWLGVLLGACWIAMATLDLATSWYYAFPS